MLSVKNNPFLREEPVFVGKHKKNVDINKFRKNFLEQ
jgi:hypothetical protein